MVLVRGDRRIARVDTHAHPRLHAVGPLVPDERPLPCQRRVHCILRSREGDEECVSLGADTLPARLLEDVAEDPVMLGEHVTVLLAEPADERRRALDVSEQEGVGPGQASGSLACIR